MARVDWDAAMKFIEDVYFSRIRADLGQFLAECKGWECTPYTANYPPRIVLIFKHAPISDQRRAERHDISGSCLAYLNEAEMAEVADFLAEMAKKHRLRAGWFEKAEGGATLIYQLRPYYERDFGIK